MKNIDYLEAFRDYLVEEEKSEGTISSYISDVKDFIQFMKNKSVKKIQRENVSAYKEYLREKRKLKTLTINRKLVGVKQFIDFLNDRFELSISARVKQEKVQKQYSLKDHELLTEVDYEKLIAAVKDAGDTRAKVLFESMYFSGMRISEALQLRVDHVNESIKVIEDIKGKGSKYREIFVNDKLMESLKEYLLVRKQPYASTTKLLFVGERGPITRQTAHTLIKKYAKKAGIPETKAHVHNLRHLFGLRLADKGVPIQTIAKFMGHSNIEVTRVYTEKPQSYYANLIDQL